MNQQDLSGRLARWALKIQGYNFKIEHRKGSENIVPDCLSRKDNSVDQIDFFPTIDTNAEKFKSQDYLEKIQMIEKNPSRFPDL